MSDNTINVQLIKECSLQLRDKDWDKLKQVYIIPDSKLIPKRFWGKESLYRKIAWYENEDVLSTEEQEKITRLN